MTMANFTMSTRIEEKRLCHAGDTGSNAPLSFEIVVGRPAPSRGAKFMRADRRSPQLCWFAAMPNMSAGLMADAVGTSIAGLA